MSEGDNRQTRRYYTRATARNDSEASTSAAADDQNNEEPQDTQHLRTPVHGLDTIYEADEENEEIAQDAEELTEETDSDDGYEDANTTGYQTTDQETDQNEDGDQQIPEVFDTVHSELGGLLFNTVTRQGWGTRRRLHYQPRLNPRLRPGRGAAMNPQNPPLQNPKVRSIKYKGKPKEDPDCHVAQFQTRWEASGYDTLYAGDVKKRQFAATLEGPTMDWFSQYGLAHYRTYAALRDAFLARFRKEKTANDVISKIKTLQQKSMLVEDYAQKFRTLAGRLTGADALSDEMKATYFLKGLDKTIRASTANVDIGTGFDQLVTAAVRVEKRLGTSKKKSKKKKTDDSDSDSDSDSDEENSDSESDDGDSDSDSDSDDGKASTSKKRKSKRKKSSKSKDKGKKKKKQEVVDDQLLKRLQALESVSVITKEKPVCQICTKEGHLASNCWYNPSFQGRVPLALQRSRDQRIEPTVNQIFPVQARGGIRQSRMPSR